MIAAVPTAQTQAIDFEALGVQDSKAPIKDRKFPIIEIFGPTVQGEGSVLGMITSFVRFGGCDYRCTMCDSLHAVLPDQIKKNATYMTAEEIAAKVKAISAPMVTFSGGNPAMHNLDRLVNIFNEDPDSPAIAIETQGTIWRPWLMKCHWVTISPKGPGMGEKFEPNKFKKFIDELTGNDSADSYKQSDWHGRIPRWSVKVVVMNAVDLDFAKQLMKDFPDIASRMYLSLGNPIPPTVVSMDSIKAGKPTQAANFDIRPVLLDHYKNLTEMILRESELRECKITPQLHVLLWGNRQGV